MTTCVLLPRPCVFINQEPLFAICFTNKQLGPWSYNVGARPFDWVLIYNDYLFLKFLIKKKASEVVLLSILKCWSFFYDSCWRCESLDHDHSHHGRLGSWIKCHHNGYTNTLYTTIIMFYNLSFLILLYNDGVFIFLVDFFDGNNAQSCLLRLSSTGLVYYSYKYWCNGRKSSGHHAHCLVQGGGGVYSGTAVALYSNH